MKIVQIPRRFVAADWGGTETVVLESSKRLRAWGHDSRILCPRALSDTRYERLEGVPVERVDYFYPYLGLGAQERHQLDKKGGNLFSFELMSRLQRMERPDVLHLHTGKRLGGCVRRVARMRRIPYVLTLHGGLFDVPGDEAQSWTAPTRGTLEWGRALGWWVGARRVEQEASAIFTLGEAERRQVQQRFPHVPVHLLPNGVDVERFSRGQGERFRAHLGLDPGQRLIVSVGRIDPQKDQLTALAACDLLAHQHPDVHLAFVGPVTNADYLATLTREIAARGLGERVSLVHGASPQLLVDALHASQVFLHSSLHEPFGIVILEAWAAGCPVVATRVGGVPGFVADGRDARLVEARQPASMASALAELLANPPQARALAERGRAKAAHYSWDNVTRRLLAIYEEVRRAHSVCA